MESKELLKNVNPMLSHINVGTGTDVTIKELSETVKDIVGFTGVLVFDQSKPDGTPQKLMNVDKLSSLGWQSSTALKEGLSKSYQDYLHRYASI